MIRKLERDRLASELGSLDALLASIPEASLTMRSAYEARKHDIKAKLAKLDATLDTTASAAIFFGGKRVQGSETIDAEFAAESLKAFQGVVAARALCADGASLGQRGPLPAREDLRLNISGTARGSFGFLLEENATAGRPLFASALKEALSRATDIIAGFAGSDDDDFAAQLEDMDERLLASVRTLFRTLKTADASLRIVEGDREESLDQAAVTRAFDRAAHTELAETDVVMSGTLLGLTPISGRFEFRQDGSTETIQGKTGPQLSREYLERIERDGVALGGHGQWMARLRRKIVVRPRAAPKETYVLEDLVPRMPSEDDDAV